MCNWSPGSWGRRYVNKKMAKNYPHLMKTVTCRTKNTEKIKNKKKNKEKEVYTNEYNNQIAENCG